MKITQVNVDFRKTVSDGNYGNETVTAGYAVELQADEDGPYMLRLLLSAARGAVFGELRQSNSLNIRRALLAVERKCNRCGESLPDEERGYMHGACSEAELAERNARREAVRGEAYEEADADLEDLPL